MQGAVFCQPLLAICFFPAGISTLSALTPPRYRNISVSLAIPPAFLIGGGVPLAVGWFGDVGLFPHAFILTGTLIMLGIGLTALLPPIKRRVSVDTPAGVA